MSNVEELKKFIEKYKKIREHVELRMFFTNFENNDIKKIIQLVKENKNLQQEFTSIELYYANEMLLVYECFKYIQLIAQNSKKTGMNKNLREQYLRFYEDNGHTVEFYLAQKVLSDNEKQSIRGLLQSTKLESKYCYYARVERLLSFYKTGAEDLEVQKLAQHLYLVNNEYARSMEEFKRKCSDEDKRLAIEMYRKIFITSEQQMVLDILNRPDQDNAVREFLSKGYTEEEMNRITSAARLSNLLNLNQFEKNILFDFMTKFRESAKTYKTETKKIVVKEDRTFKNLTLEEAQEVIKKFEQSGYSTKVGFCVNNEIDFDYFKACMDLVQANRPKKTRKKVSEIQILYTEMADKIENGVKEDNRVRKFDLIDYYNLTDHSIKTFLAKLAYYSDNHQIEVVKKFLYGKADASENIGGIKLTLDVKMDSEGKPIPGTGRTITPEETDKCVEYLKENGIPVNMLTYKAAVRRYADGYIVFDQKVKRK